MGVPTMACHRMKRSDIVIIKFIWHKQKQSAMHKHKNLGIKFQELSNLNFLGRLLYVCLLKFLGSESMPVS